MTTVGARYEGAPGLVTLRRQIARRAVEAGVALSENDLCTTIGATEALSLALRAVAKPGDIIAVESPAYFGVLQTIEGLGLRALEIPANPRTGLDVSALEETLRTQPIRAVGVTPTVSNPLGAAMPGQARVPRPGAAAPARGGPGGARWGAGAGAAGCCSWARCPGRSRRATAWAGSP